MRALVEADVLKVRRRRGLWWSAMLIPPGLVALVALLGALISNSDIQGGAQFARDSRAAVAFVLGIISALVGARMGADEHALGTFRYQVLTGRPRVQLFASKAAALLVIVTLATLAATTVVALGSLLPPTDGPGMGLKDLGKAFWDAWVPGAVYGCLALGVGALIRATGGAIALSLILQFAGISLFLALTLIDDSLKYLILSSALDRVTEDSITDPDYHLALGGAIACIALWVGGFLTAGAVRTQRSED